MTGRPVGPQIEFWVPEAKEWLQRGLKTEERGSQVIQEKRVLFGSGSGQRAKPEWSTLPVGHGQVFAARKPTLLKRGYSHKAA